MKKSLVKAAVSAAASFAVLVSGTINSLAADTSYYTLTLLDFHGEVMTTIQVEAGSAPDLSAVDTDSLHEYVGVDTEKRFSSWSEVPQEMTADMTIQALYRQMTISADSEPSKKKSITTATAIFPLTGLKLRSLSSLSCLNGMRTAASLKKAIRWI